MMYLTDIPCSCIYLLFKTKNLYKFITFEHLDRAYDRRFSHCSQYYTIIEIIKRKLIRAPSEEFILKRRYAHF